MTTAPYVSPPTFVILTTEELPLDFDASAMLEDGQTISDQSAVMQSLNDSTIITLADPPTVVGNVITQVVIGDQLTGGAKYRLIITFTAAPGVIWSMPLIVEVPF